MYQIEGLNEINKKYPDIDFSKLDGKVVVPVGAICEKLGLNVVFQNLKNGIAGYFDDSQKTIFINEKYSATRNLFTIAHEIGHFILHTGLNYRFD
ncbi:MAG: Zn-dependent peptidase ImmA (M78 family), partial [Candidatus Deianiraeaceae bacterium]